MAPSHPTPLSHDSKLSTQNPAPRTPTPCKPYTLKALTPFVAAVLSERASLGPWKQRPLVNVGVGFRVQACESFKAKKGTTMVPFWASLRAFGFLGRGSGSQLTWKSPVVEHVRQPQPLHAVRETSKTHPSPSGEFQPQRSCEEDRV